MLGFLALGALGGTAAVAWPLYLHLRRRERVRVQVVPSLVLFAAAASPRRSVRFEERLLLAARASFLVVLALLLAQPYVESALELPLPRIDERPAESFSLCVLVDDSLTSLDGPPDATRLESCARWLGPRLRRLPEGTRVRLALTSYPGVSGALECDRAADLVERLRTIPRPGDAAAALARLAGHAAGRPSAIVVAAPRDASLWGDLAPGTDLAAEAELAFLDLTAPRLEAYVHAVAAADVASGGHGWVVSFAGTTASLANAALTVERSDGRSWSVSLTGQDAERGRTTVSLPACASDQWYRARLASAGEHPWGTWYFRADEARAGAVSSTLAVVRARTPEGLLADKLVSAALLALRPDAEILHLDAGGSPDGIEPAGAAVVVGCGAPGVALGAWVAAVLERGGRVLCIPTGEEAGQVPPQATLPSWGVPSVVDARDVVPLAADASARVAGGWADPLLVDGLGEARHVRMREPILAGGERVIATRDGRTFLAARRAGERGIVWALGVPISLTPGSLAFHPSFPLLLERTLVARRDVRQDAAAPAQVGGYVDLLAWFGVERIDGAVVLPGGARREARGERPGRVAFGIGEAGPHVLDVGGAPVARVANYPRPGRDATFTRDDWAARRPHTRTNWLAEGDELPCRPSSTSVARAGAGVGRYDLSPVAVVLVGLSMAVEGAALLAAWRRREAAHG